MTGKVQKRIQRKGRGKRRLTPKQEAFVREYLTDLNATQAAVRAGYSARTAYSIGEENLRKPEIQTAIQDAMKEREERTQITQDQVIQGLFKEATTAQSDAARVSAWAWLGKHLAMFTDKSELVGSVPVRLITKIPRPDDDD